MSTEVIYKCRCMKEEAKLEIPARRDDEEIGSWMNILQAALTVDHRKRSPLCVRTAMEYAKIYVPPDGGIGMEKKVH